MIGEGHDFRDFHHFRVNLTSMKGSGSTVLLILTWVMYEKLYSAKFAVVM